MENKDIVFQCRKCEHQLFVTHDKINTYEDLVFTLKNLMEMDCPNCGEEGYENWVLSRMGNYEKEYC